MMLANRKINANLLDFIDSGGTHADVMISGVYPDGFSAESLGLLNAHYPLGYDIITGTLDLTFLEQWVALEWVISIGTKDGNSFLTTSKVG